jgi:hypothetical protein
MNEKGKLETWITKWEKISYGLEHALKNPEILFSAFWLTSTVEQPMDTFLGLLAKIKCLRTHGYHLMEWQFTLHSWYGRFCIIKFTFCLTATSTTHFNTRAASSYWWCLQLLLKIERLENSESLAEWVYTFTQALNPSTHSFLGHGSYGIIHYLGKGATQNRSDLPWLLKEVVLCLLACEGREISTIDLHQGLKLTYKLHHTEVFKKPYKTW